jgi:hypothetical protein
MGYYTNYEVKIEGYVNDEIFDALLHFEMPSGGSLKSIFDLRNSDCAMETQAKWHDHESDLLTLSKAFPNVVIHVNGIGEDFDDIWSKHFQNGRHYKEDVHFPKYNPLLLK